MKTYKIEFNDYGVVYVFAEDFKLAEDKFWRKYGGNSPSFTIKSITLIGEGLV